MEFQNTQYQVHQVKCICHEWCFENDCWQSKHNGYCLCAYDSTLGDDELNRFCFQENGQFYWRKIPCVRTFPTPYERYTIYRTEWLNRGQLQRWRAMTSDEANMLAERLQQLEMQEELECIENV